MTKTNNGAFAEVLARNQTYIPGGISSTNRTIAPPMVFARAQGAYLWDTEENRYIDYHAAFGPYLLGHNFAPVNDAAREVLTNGESLFGAGVSGLQGKLAELICKSIPVVEKITLL